jgi:AAA domain
MRIAISGSHGTGKSTLIAAFLERCPAYVHEPEAFETLGDEVELTTDEGPTADGLRLLLEHTLVSVARHPAGASVVFERSPVDYLAYGAASRSWPRGEVRAFLAAAIPAVRESVRGLDLIALLTVVRGGPAVRAGESPRFRKRVDAALQRALLDDEHDLFAGAARPTVVELPPGTGREVEALVRLAGGRP